MSREHAGAQVCPVRSGRKTRELLVRLISGTRAPAGFVVKADVHETDISRTWSKERKGRLQELFTYRPRMRQPTINRQLDRTKGGKTAQLRYMEPRHDLSARKFAAACR